MPDAVPLQDMLARMLQAIELERSTVQQALGKLGELGTVRVRDGRLLVPEPGAYLYRFRCDLDLHLPVDTPLLVMASAESSAADVFEHDVELERLDLSLRGSLGETVPEAILHLDPSYLLTALAARLQTILDQPEQFSRERGLALLSGQPGAPPPRDEAAPPPSSAPSLPSTSGPPALNSSQESAIDFVLQHDVSYVWGPPGTGKTWTVGHLVRRLVERGERVLLTAHTNVATDNALLQVLETGAWAPGEALRIGARGERLQGRGVSLDDVLHARLLADHPELARSAEELCRRIASALAEPPRRLTSAGVPLPKRLLAAADLARREKQSDLAEEAARLLESFDPIAVEALKAAKVVATTLTRLFTNRPVMALRPENVIIDEASVAALPHSFIAGCMATRRAVAVGDFMQLPTIVRSDHPQVRDWMGRHVFASAGADDPERDHPQRVMLAEQYRMHPDISRVVSHHFYADRLRDSARVLESAEPPPAVLLLDSVSRDCRSESTRTGSKQNLAHARIVSELVLAASTRDVAVITPYRAQVRAIREALRSRNAPGLESGEVEVFTVHRFQGRDKELVIFDTVEAPGTPCRFLDELRNTAAPNLVNVALSRAKRRLIIVGHLRHLVAGLGSESLLGRIFRFIRAQGGLEREWACEEDRGEVTRFLGHR